MAEIGVLPVPGERAVLANPTPAELTPEQLDASSYQATAGEFRKGVRSGFNQLGASLEALAGNLGDTLGLTDFAAQRFAEADHFARFADAVSPSVRDIRDIKDFDSLADFVAGQAGNAAASFAPAVLGGAVGARLGGLRGATVGLGAGSFLPNAGEQAQNIRGLPGSPGAKTANALGVGAVNAALDTVSTGRVARQLAKPSAMGLKAMGKEVLKASAVEGLTEGAQDVVGQGGEMLLDPSKKLDPWSVANSAAAGAVGGGALGGAGAVAGVAPGAAAKAAGAVRDMLPKRSSPEEGLDEALGVVKPPVDSNDLSSLINDPKLGDDPEKLGEAIDRLDSDEESSLRKIAGKMGRAAAEVEDIMTDPDRREALKGEARKWWNDSQVAPKVRRAVDSVKRAMAEGAEAAKKAYGDERAKHSLGRTVLDAQVLDTVKSKLPSHVLENVDDEQLQSIAAAVKHAAMYSFGERRQVEGPGRPAFELGAADRREQDRGTIPDRLPSGLLSVLGKDAVGTIQAVQDVLRAGLGEGQVKGRPRQAVAEAVGRVKRRRSGLERAIHENLKDEFWNDAKLRRQATEGFMDLLAADRAPGELTAKEGAEGQRLSESGRNIMTAAGYMFRDRAKAMRDIEALEQSEGFAAFAREHHMTEDEITDVEEHARGADEAADDGDVDGWRARRDAAEGAFNDARLRAYDTVEEARQAHRALEQDYDRRHVQFRAEQETEYDPESGQLRPTGRVVLSARERDGAVGLSGAPAKEVAPGQWRGAGQWGAITDKSLKKKAGFEHGTVTVTRTSGEVVRVSLKALAAEAARTSDFKGSKRYAHDVVMEGLSMLLTDPTVQGVAEKKGRDLGAEQWDFPPQTVMAHLNGRDYTWGEIVKMTKMSKAELKMKHMTERPVDYAREADSIQEIEERVLPWVDGRLDELQARLDREEAALEKAKKRYPAGAQALADTQKFRDIAKSRVDRMLATKERVLEEIDRREREGDVSLEYAMEEVVGTNEEGDEETRRVAGDEGRLRSGMSRPGRSSEKFELGENNVDEQMLSPVSKDPEGERFVQEETGETLHGAPRVKSEGGRLDTGLRPEDRASGPVTVREEQQTPADKARPVTQPREEGGEVGPDGDRAQVDKALADRQLKANLRKAGAKLSDARVGATEPLTEEKKQEVRDYVKKVLGSNKAKVAFKNMAHAGSFIFNDKTGVEELRIATLAVDPMGAARHEAAHAVFLRLLKSDKQAAQALLAAANSPFVVSRLRELLKGHPEALSQIDGSTPGHAEERLAYAYQFWSAGERVFQVGPSTGKWFDKVKAFFRTIAGIWSETIVDQQNMDKAAKVFDLFDRGELSDRNTVAEVLREKMPKSAMERATQLMGPVGKFFDKAFFTSDGYVRGMNIPAFNETLDKFFTPLGKQGAGPGYNQEKHVAINQQLNRVVAALRGTTEAQQREALEALQAGEEPKSAAARAAAAKVRVVLRDTYEYMKRKGVKAVVWNPAKSAYEEHELGFVQDYFPRMYDKARIAADRKGFEAMLVRNAVPAKDAADIAERIMRDGKVDPDENDASVGLTYYAPNTQERKLDVPAAELAPYLRKDLYGTMSSYVSYAARRAEYAERFGNQGQEIEKAVARALKDEGATEEQVRGFRQAVQAWEGSLGHDIGPEMKRVFGAVVTYQNFRLLPLALFSSLVDPIGIAVRGGGPAEAFGAFARGVRELVSDKSDDARELALAVGSIADSTDAHMVADAYGSQYLSDHLRQANEKFFKWNGMESWNRSMRIAATAAAEKFIVRHVTRPNEHSERYLRELGLEPGQVKVENGRLDPTDLKVRGAINLWVDGAVVRPNAHIRPVWMSDPHWMLVSHLKQFTYGFQKTVISRVVHEMENGNYTPAYALASYVPFIVAADVMRAALTPGSGDDDAFEKLDLKGVLWRGVQRAGLVGPGQYALDAYGDLGHAKMPLVSLAGPSFQQLYDFGTAAANHGDVGRELMKGIPGYVLVK